MRTYILLFLIALGAVGSVAAQPSLVWQNYIRGEQQSDDYAYQILRLSRTRLAIVGQRGYFDPPIAGRLQYGIMPSVWFLNNAGDSIGNKSITLRDFRRFSWYTQA